MARTIFLLVVLLNLIALAWIYLKGDELTDAGREPERAKQVLSTDKIRLLPAEGSPEQPSAVTTAAESCRAFVGAPLAEAQVIAKTWVEKLPAVRIAVNPVMPAPMFDIVITGLTKRSEAETSLAELKKFGVSEGAQVRAEGKDKGFSLVIASFTERGAAKVAFNSAVKKGISAAQIVERQPEPELAIIEVRGADAALAKLPELLLLSAKTVSAADCKPGL